MHTTRFRGQLLAGLLAVVVGATAACSSGDGERVQTFARPAPAAPAPEQPTERKQITAARLVADGLGWATTPTGLFVTENAGSTWRRWPLPAPADNVLAVALQSPQRALLAVDKGGTVQVFSTGDAGANWKATTLGTPLGGVSEATFAHQGDRVAGLLVKRASSSNFSLADWYATKDGGATWARREAPAAGEVSVGNDGTLWLAGGPGRDQLFSSTDGGATWSEVALPPNLARGARAVEPPAARRDGVAVLPVTLPGERTSSVVFLTTRDKGRTWREAARAQVPGSVGSGTAIPASPAAQNNTLVVVAPDGSEIVRVPLGGGQARRVKPRGLRKGVVRVKLTTEQIGWATSTSSSCAGDKTDCTSSTDLLVTRDGGESWQPANPG